MIKGIPVTLYERTQSGVDGFGTAVFSETAVSVSNVLIQPLSDSDEILDRTNLVGDVTRYRLAIPKGDTHTWGGNRVQFFGQTFKVVGFEIQGIEAMIPLSWNKKVVVERIG